MDSAEGRRNDSVLTLDPRPPAAGPVLWFDKRQIALAESYPQSKLFPKGGVGPLRSDAVFACRRCEGCV